MLDAGMLGAGGLGVGGLASRYGSIDESPFMAAKRDVS
jgi:hypothetical protein